MKHDTDNTRKKVALPQKEIAALHVYVCERLFIYDFQNNLDPARMRYAAAKRQITALAMR